MSQWAAFLRAINIGGRTVKMERLRELFASAGYTNVKTFIASGNVIFSTKQGDAGRLEREIETLLREALGFEVATFVRSLPAVAEIASSDPFDRGPGAEPEWFIGFLKALPPTAAQHSVHALSSKMDQLEIRGRELYWLCRTRISDSPVSGAVLERKLGMPLTIRNSRTLRRIAAAYLV